MDRLIRRTRLNLTPQEVWAGIALTLLTGLLIAFQYSTLEKFTVVPPGTGLATLQEWIAYAQGRIGLTWRDAILPLAMVGACGALVCLELRRRNSAA